MRRLTWMLYNHRILMPEHLSKENYFAEADGSNKIDTGYLMAHLKRQPMQRTCYYMPWGVVTVDELSKMVDERLLIHSTDYLAGDAWDDDAPYEMS